MTATPPTPAGTVKVKRDSAKGYHFIDQAKYDANPKAFELLDDPRAKTIDRGQRTQTQPKSDQGKSREELRAVVIPANWRALQDSEIVGLVTALSGNEPKTLEEAAAVIDGELALRAQEDAPKA